MSLVLNQFGNPLDHNVLAQQDVLLVDGCDSSMEQRKQRHRRAKLDHRDQLTPTEASDRGRNDLVVRRYEWLAKR